MRTKLIATLAGLVVGCSFLQSCAWYPKKMDRDIAALNADIATRRTALTANAASYRATPGQGFQIDLSGKPLKGIIDKFDSLSFGDRTMSMISTGAGGRFGEVWTDCPWPLSGHLGLYLEPINLPGTFASVVYIDKLEYQGWSSQNGLEFAFRGTAGAGFIVVLGGVDFCFGSVSVLPIPVGVVGYTYYAAGGADISPSPGKGIDYTISLQQPLYFLAVADILGYVIPAPLWLKPQLFSGTLANIVGQDGEVDIVQNGKGRKYSIDINFNQAKFISNGLTSSGAIVINWKP
jgi:hypothetical protein